VAANWYAMDQPVQRETAALGPEPVCLSWADGQSVAFEWTLSLRSFFIASFMLDIRSCGQPDQNWRPPWRPAAVVLNGSPQGPLQVLFWVVGTLSPDAGRNGCPRTLPRLHEPAWVFSYADQVARPAP
jgi:hypothetical protein